ncbi:hypothetical protein [Frankia sp. AgKG'84/4]|uniref:hypothetical protein n=1 Tax=Frankia sp. AgKG'84/4 TaxID=573490 RepID=UPI00200FF88E|nr:hypothetical protein [Frankia sp. AgKG'84/4]MCL9794803.1 hypothetical protein [Frankia sp. AgKG'84/4]
MQLYHFAAPGAVAPTYTTTSSFTALSARVDVNAPLGYSFLTNGANVAPVIQTLAAPAAPALWVSDLGNLAIEQADLTQRQPRHFFAAQNAIPDWNRALAKAGSDFQLIAETGSTVTFTLPAGGPARTLVKVFPANLNLGSAGDLMWLTENCDGLISNVTGSGGVPGAELRSVLNQPVYSGVGAGQDEQWEEPGPRGKGFANGITAVVEPTVRAGLHYFVQDSKDSHGDVGTATSVGELQRALLKGLNYANRHLYPTAGPDGARKARIQAWRARVTPLTVGALPAYVGAAHAVQTRALANHVCASLNAVTANTF